MRKILLVMLAFTMGITLVGCEETSPGTSDSTEAGGETTAEGDVTTSESPSQNGEIKTGEIKIKLFPEVAPIAVQNFIDLTEDGYYEGKLVHRIIPQFMFQGGSPKGDGMSEDYEFFSIEPSQEANHIYGALAMANAGPDRNAQQFYVVNNKNGVHQLDGNYTVFGQTLEGFDVIDAVSSVGTGQDDKPFNDVVIESVTINTFSGGDDPDDDSIIGNVGGEVKLENGDTYAVMKIRYSE